MSISPEMREKVRVRYNYCCAYCSVSEIDIGGLLEIEHFRPVSKGGTDSLDNLVYACTICNRHKASYWPEETVSDNLRLLHPGIDRIEEHTAELTNGTLIGLTERGWFHINWLHLNRPQLIGFRQLRLQRQNRDTPLQSLEAAYQRLYQRNAELEEEITWLQSVIRQLLSRT